MADEPEGTPAEAEPAGGKPAPGGKAPAKGGKFHALINGPHRDEILVVTSVIGVLLAWVTFKKTGTTSTAQGTTAATSTIAPTNAALAGTSGQVLGSSDPTASAGLSSYLQNMTQELQTLQTQVTASATAATPTATPYALDLGDAAAADKYTRNNVTGEIDQVQSNGNNVWLTPQQYAAVGAPTPTPYTGSSAIDGHAVGYVPPATTTTA